MNPWAAIAFCVCAIGFLEACGSKPPCSQAPSTALGSPEITAFSFVGTVGENNPAIQTKDPWHLVFRIAFTDTDGNMGKGSAEFTILGSATSSTLLLEDSFLENSLPLTATQGEFGIALRFSDQINNGSKTRLGLQLSDEKGNRSNCFALELTFDITTAWFWVPTKCQAA